jgi:predicted O-linked N-acetylglucosamine transferase (SPINDLY family)
MTHVLVDSLVAPPDHAAEFSESIVLLPPTFYVNDHMQYFRPEIHDAAAAAIAAGDSFLSPNVTRRLQHGLPSDGTVMANFNQPYKMNSASARAACIALASSANTTWWASDGPAVYRAAVLAACRRLGVSSSRILFSAPVGIIDFVERLGAADVSQHFFLFPNPSPLFSPAALPRARPPPPPPSPLRQLFIDTVPLGAHTVAMDALALGTPIVAVAGTLYAHRVSSSILAAAGALCK